MDETSLLGVEAAVGADGDVIDDATRSRDLMLLDAGLDEGRYGDGQVDVPVPVTEAGQAARRARRRIDLVAVGALLLVLVAVAVAATLDRTSGAGTRPSVTRYAEVSQPRAEVVPAPVELVGTVDDGAATFTWTNPRPSLPPQESGWWFRPPQCRSPGTACCASGSDVARAGYQPVGLARGGAYLAVACREPGSHMRGGACPRAGRIVTFAQRGDLYA